MASSRGEQPTHNDLSGQAPEPPIWPVDLPTRHTLGQRLGGLLTLGGHLPTLHPHGHGESQAHTAEEQSEEAEILKRALTYRAGGNPPKNDLWAPASDPTIAQFQAVDYTLQYIDRLNDRRDQAARDLRTIINTPNVRGIRQRHGAETERYLDTHQANPRPYEAIVNPANVRALCHHFMASGGNLTALRDRGIAALDSRHGAGYLGVNRIAWLEQRDNGPANGVAVSPVALDQLDFMLRLDAAAQIRNQQLPEDKRLSEDLASPLTLLISGSAQEQRDRLTNAQQAVASRLATHASLASDPDVYAARALRQQRQPEINWPSELMPGLLQIDPARYLNGTVQQLWELRGRVALEASQLRATYPQQQALYIRVLKQIDAALDAKRRNP